MSDLYLYVYDLSKGLAKQLSAMFLGMFQVIHFFLFCQEIKMNMKRNKFD